MERFNRDRIDMLPAEMTSRAQWVCWKNDNGSKVPINPNTGGLASSTSPKTWGDLDKALAALESDNTLTGIGFVFTEDDDLVGIDLDKCIDEQGELLEWAQRKVELFNSYCEISPSGKGVHIIGKGVLPAGQGRKRDNIEVYDRGRYFTVSGRIMDLDRTEIRDVQQAIEILIHEFGGKARRDSMEWQSVNIVVDTERVPPFAKYEALREADLKFKKSCDRKRADMKDSSPSAYDMSLASMASRAGWTDQEIADLLVYCRVKNGEDLKRKDYFQRTVFNVRAESEVADAMDNLDCMASAEDGMEAIRVVTNLRIKEIVQVNKIDSHWIIRFEDGDQYVFGDTVKVMSKQAWDCLMMEHKVGSLKVNAKQWTAFKAAIQRVAVLEENPQMLFHEQLMDWIKSYTDCSEGKPVEETSEEFEYVFTNSRPYLDTDGRLHLSAESLRRFVFQNGDKYSLPKVYSALHALGFKTTVVSKWIEGRTVSKRYWRSTLDASRI